MATHTIGITLQNVSGLLRSSDNAADCTVCIELCTALYENEHENVTGELEQNDTLSAVFQALTIYKSDTDLETACARLLSILSCDISASDLWSHAVLVSMRALCQHGGANGAMSGALLCALVAPADESEAALTRAAKRRRLCIEGGGVPLLVALLQHARLQTRIDAATALHALVDADEESRARTICSPHCVATVAQRLCSDDDTRVHIRLLQALEVAARADSLHETLLCAGVVDGVVRGVLASDRDAELRAMAVRVLAHFDTLELVQRSLLQYKSSIRAILDVLRDAGDAGAAASVRNAAVHLIAVLCANKEAVGILLEEAPSEALSGFGGANKESASIRTASHLFGVVFRAVAECRLAVSTRINAMGNSAADATPTFHVSPHNATALAVRRRVIGEIAAAGNQFGTKLAMLVHVFYHPLAADIASTPNPMLSEAELHTVFGDVETLEAQNAELWLRLHRHCEQWPQHDESLGSLVLELAKCAHRLLPCADNFEQAEVVHTQCMQSKARYRDFVERGAPTREGDGGGGRALIGLLLEPVRFVPRLVTLLRSLAAHVPDEHADAPALQLAIAQVSPLQERFALTLSRHERALKMQELQEKLLGTTSYIRAGRYLQRQGEAKMLVDKAVKDVNLFLLDDLLLVCKSKKAKFKVKYELRLADLRLETYPHANCAFYLVQRVEKSGGGVQTELVLQFRDEMERDAWLEATRKAMRTQKMDLFTTELSKTRSQWSMVTSPVTSPASSPRGGNK